MKLKLFTFIFAFVFIVSWCRATPVLDSAQGSPGGNNLTLPSGSQLYVFVMAAGGFYPSSPFAAGQSIQVQNVCCGNTAEELAATTSNNNSYTTSCAYFAIAGFGASNFHYVQGFYAANPGPSAHSASVQFTLDAPALVVLIGGASSQQYLTFSGLPNLVTDVPYNTVEATGIAHATLEPGTYTAQETSLDTVPGQTPTAMVDLLGVLIFSDYPSAAVSSNPQIPLPITPQSPASQVNGKVLNSSGQAIADASVQIGSNLAASGSDGSYSITGLSAGNYPVTVSAVGYTTLSSTLAVPASAQISQNFRLNPVPASGSLLPVTVSTKYNPDGQSVIYFLDGVTFPVTFTANVNWGTHQAGTVLFITPNYGIYQVNANGGNVASQQIDVGHAFGPGGKLQVQAVSSDGVSSIATVANFVVMSSLPLQNLSAFTVIDEGNHFEYQSQTASSIQFLNKDLSDDGYGVEVDTSIPLLGGNSLGLGFSPTLNATITGNHLDLLQVEVSGSLKNNNDDNGDEDDSEDDENGPTMDMAGVGLHLNWPDVSLFANYTNYNSASNQWLWGGSLEITGDANVSPPPVYLPIPIPVPVYVSAEFDLSADATLSLYNLNPVVWNGTVNLDPSVTGALGAGVDGLLAVEGWVKGGVDFNLQYPQKPHLEYYQIQLSAGVTVYALLWSYSDQLFTWDWPQNPSPQIVSSFLKRPASPQPYPRNYLKSSSYAAFHSQGLGTASTSGIKPLDLTPPSTTQNPSLYALQTDVLPFSESSMAASGTTCYAVWLYDDPNRSANNRTVIVFSKYDGTEWSDPTPVADDGTADFHPQIKEFSDGSAVVTWENEGSVLSTNADFNAMITNLEISTAFYDPVVGQWQPMQQITTNGYLDRSPRIAGVTENNLMLVWVANPNNDLEEAI